MKKLHLCLISTLLAASMHAQSIDYTKGLSIWFDKPNNLDGRDSWYAPTADNHGKVTLCQSETEVWEEIYWAR